jgi:hypothetical protein
MITLPLSPYHKNLCDYWNTRTDINRIENFWSWIKCEYNADLDLHARPERWKFENEKDAAMFLLRWA